MYSFSHFKFFGGFFSGQRKMLLVEKRSIAFATVPGFISVFFLISVALLMIAEFLRRGLAEAKAEDSSPESGHQGPPGLRSS